jgi:hypothetical protein
MLMSRRDLPHGNFNPTRHAAKAFAAGTALCLSVSGLTAFAVGQAMGVNSVGCQSVYVDHALCVLYLSTSFIYTASLIYVTLCGIG